MVCDAGSWAPQLAALASEVEVIVPTYGEAPSFTHMARVVLQQAPERFALAGHSMGGRVALEVCRLAPSRVQRLCLVSTEFRGCPEGAEGARETAGRMALREVAMTAGMAAMAAAWMKSLLPAARLRDASLVQAIVAMVTRFSPLDLARHIEAGATRPDSTETLAALRCPVLLIGGDEDCIRPLPVLEEMAAQIADSQLITLAGCGHMPMLERPAEVTQALRDWLAGSLPDAQENLAGQGRCV